MEIIRLKIIRYVDRDYQVEITVEYTDSNMKAVALLNSYNIISISQKDDSKFIICLGIVHSFLRQDDIIIIPKMIIDDLNIKE